MEATQLRIVSTARAKAGHYPSLGMNKQKARGGWLKFVSCPGFARKIIIVLVYRKPAKWIEMENSTKTVLTNVTRQAVHALNNTAPHFAAHSSTIQAPRLPVTAAFGFLPGLMFGLKKG